MICGSLWMIQGGFRDDLDRSKPDFMKIPSKFNKLFFRTKTDFIPISDFSPFLGGADLGANFFIFGG